MSRTVALSALLISAALSAAVAGEVACTGGSMDAGCVFKPQDDWLFLVLVETWPGTFCADGCCKVPSSVKEIADGFTLHGLWPNYAGCKYPACCSSPFPQSVVDAMIQKDEVLERDLATYWPALKRCLFVQYEYNKHGTCAATVFSDVDTGPIDYFRAALELRKRWDFLRALKEAGIVPGSSRKYKPQTEILPAIARLTGTTACLACTNGSLAEVRVCIQRPANAKGQLEPFDCPLDFVKSNSNCNSGGISIPDILDIPAGSSECQI